MKKAILVDKKVVIVESTEVWAQALEDKDRIVAQDDIGNLKVSTVFLGLDHGWGGPPLWFETMIFGGDEEYQERCGTWEEAEVMHKRAVKKAESMAGIRSRVKRKVKGFLEELRRI